MDAIAGLTREQKIRVLTELAVSKGDGSEAQQKAYQEIEWRRCEKSVVYFIQRYGYIIDEGRVTKWELWPIQEWVLRDLESSQSVVGVKARQLGITTTVSHFALWDCIFHEATTWDNISASEEKAKDIIKRIQATKDRLPKWMTDRATSRAKEMSHVRKKDRTDSTTRLSFGLSEMKIATSTVKSIQGASNNINLDEATLHSELKRKLQQMHASLDGGGGTAAVIANGAAEDEFFKFYQASKRGTTGFKAYFFWWGDDPTRLDDWEVEIGGVKRQASGVPREQLMEYAEKFENRIECPWYTRMLDKFLTDNEEADKFAFFAVYPTNEEEAFYISANCRFKLAVLQAQKERALALDKPIRGRLEATADGKTELEPTGVGRWRIIRPPQSGQKYIIGLDSSGGGSAGDYAVCCVGQMLGDGHISQVAVFQAKCEPTELAYEGIKAGRWYNDAYLVPEANNTGQLLIDYLKADYWNIYMRKSKFDTAYTSTPMSNLGFWTDKSSKPRLIGQLSEWLNTGKLAVNDVDTLNELSHYEIKPDGISTGAPKGMNDDLVMAVALMVEGVVDVENFHVGAQPRALMTWEE